MRTKLYLTKICCGILTATFAGFAVVSIQACADSEPYVGNPNAPAYTATAPAYTTTTSTIAYEEPPYPPAVVKTYYGEPVVSYGYRDAAGVWHYTGRYDVNGVWHYGYYDSEGVWHDRDLPVTISQTHREYGYYDETGTWHETDAPTVITQATPPAVVSKTTRVTRTTTTTTESSD